MQRNHLLSSLNQSSYLFQPAGPATVPVFLDAVWEDANCRGGDQHLWAGVKHPPGAQVLSDYP